MEKAQTYLTKEAISIKHSDATGAKIAIPADETLHVRLLPWHNATSAKNGKYVAFKDVTVKGVAVDPIASGVENLEMENLTVRKEVR